MLQEYSNCLIPHLTGEGYSWFSGPVLRGEKVGEFSFTLPGNLTREGIKFLNFSLSVPKTYKYVIELGNVSHITIELTEPATGKCTCVCVCAPVQLLAHVYSGTSLLQTSELHNLSNKDTILCPSVVL